MRNTHAAPIPDLTWTDDYYEGHRQGRTAYYDTCLDVEDNPFDPSEQPITHRGWRDGWIEAKDREFDEGSAW
jgi:hypothetical protein